MDSNKKPVIGKFVIENLTVGMYDNPFCVYREYIQNSADAIDKAIFSNLIDKKDGAIIVEIDQNQRIISFEDNGTGIPENQVVSILQDVAQSDKQIGKEKGFRGIGRLGGLAYCEKLIFETSYEGEATKSTMTWDAKKLKQIVSNRTQKEEAAQVIFDVTSFNVEYEKPDKHYFKVIMEGVTNLDLLHEQETKDYLRMVAPLPFDSGFIFRSKIYEELKKENLTIDEYAVYVNNDKIYKAHSSYLYDEVGSVKKKIGEIKDIVFFKEFDKKGELLYWGWHSISDIQNERLNKVNKARGLRLRKSNIQVGDEYRLDNLFKDSRFNFYVVGEVYGFNIELIPNGRRDDFEDTPSYLDFKQKLKTICNNIQKLSYDTSAILSAQRSINNLQNLQKSIEEKQKTGFTNKDEIQKIEFELEQKREKAQQGEKVLNRYQEAFNRQEDTPLNRIFREVVKEEIPKVRDIDIPIIIQKNNFRTDRLSKLSKEQRKILSKIFDVITNVLPRELGENLILKIEEEFK